jgi:hypothetical protein
MLPVSYTLRTNLGCYDTDIVAGFDDDIQRRDSLHALINSLPDAHYATLRAIILVRP